MPDAVIVGGGQTARTCAEVLSAAGYSVRRSFDLDAHDRSPLIIGEMPGAYTVARAAIREGRHVLLAAASSLRPERLRLLFESRRRNQAVFVWSERRYHPAYRFVAGLIETDATWRPRFLRHESLSTEPAAPASFRWRTTEALALVIGLAGEAPLRAWSMASANPVSSSPDLITAGLNFRALNAHLQVGAGEAVERRETLIASATRKAFVDELNETLPVRLVNGEARQRSVTATRWMAYPSAGRAEMVRQQCLSFLEAAGNAAATAAEAALWLRCLASLEAVQRSQVTGAAVEIESVDQEPRFRLLDGADLRRTPPSVA